MFAAAYDGVEAAFLDARMAHKRVQAARDVGCDQLTIDRLLADEVLAAAVYARTESELAALWDRLSRTMQPVQRGCAETRYTLMNADEFREMIASA
jgi:hypothetical protein